MTSMFDVNVDATRSVLTAAATAGAGHALHVSSVAVYGTVAGEIDETAPIDKFSYGVANRGCSIRIPRMTPLDKCGYLEDRRPASNMDPYIVTKMIVSTTCEIPLEE